MSRLGLRSLVLSLTLVLAACAEQQPPINRVQPDAIDKAFFVGAKYVDAVDDPEFYSLGTLVDVGYGAAQDGLFTSTYGQPLTRVKWSITEDLLVARLAYERVATSDGKGLGKKTNDGIVVAAYTIRSHFDVKRSYNPATGEASNVIEENTVDRPWYERQFIRVDWSKNLSTDNYDYDTLAQTGIYGGVTYSPLAYTVKDPNSEDAPHLDAKAGYLDITNKAFAQPNLIDLGWGPFPACYFDADVSGGGAPAAACSPIELTIRQSFLKVTDKDYEAQDWDGQRFQSFGAFTTDRSGYARDYGMTDTQWHRFINRHNIWKRSHAYADPEKMTGATACYTPATTPAGKNPHRDENNDGTEDECAAVGGGSRCDTFAQKCTLPYSQREPAPVTWFVVAEGNPVYFEPSRDATHEWDVAMRMAVNTARYTECVRIGGTDCATKFPITTGQQDDNEDAVTLAKEVDDCRDHRAYAGQDCIALADSIGAKRGYSAAVIAIAKQPEMMVACHSPVEANDPGLCPGARLPAGVTAEQCHAARKTGDDAMIEICRKALNVKNGDLRFNRIANVESPQIESPWGIMVDSNDPLTGEVVSGSVNVWTSRTDSWSQNLVDTARYIKGELTTAQVTEGQNVADWAAAAEAASRGSLPRMSDDERDELISRTVGKGKKVTAEQRAAFRSSPAFAATQSLLRDFRKVKADSRAPSAVSPHYEARRKKALNTPTEAALATTMFQSMVGDATHLSSDMLSQLTSPMRGANPAALRDFHQKRELALAARGACVMNVEAQAPLAIANLADVLAEKFGAFNPSDSLDVQVARAEKMRRFLAYRGHYAVLVHEMGHSMGLRHNFFTSADPLNYRPQYWQLRTDDGTNKTACTAVDPTGACVGPRWKDPVNENERKNLIGMWMQSSVMDYPGESTQDMMGLSAYDFAAARMFYADSVAVAAGAAGHTGSNVALGLMDKMDSFGGITGIQYVFGAPTSTDRTNTTPIHYSQLQEKYGLISGCHQVNPADFKPGSWDDNLKGTFHPLIDGLIVNVKGQFTRCRQMPVDYVAWSQLRNGTAADGNASAEMAVDKKTGQVRFPYGFATDTWADLGNLSVYRSDNGADPYEFFDFMVTQNEVGHIFNNYRRGRQTFSVRGAAFRGLEAWSEKLRDGAKGVGLLANVYRDFAAAQGYDYEALWPVTVAESFPDNIVASAIGFDYFARQLARPQSGPHYLETVGTERTIRSSQDAAGNAGSRAVTIPNGATGLFGNVSFGGRPLENAYATDKGEYRTDYTVNAGSYYDKAWSAMMMAESVDNFVSDSRRDFLDPRYRSVSMADLFPDAYRRWLANNLTGDTALKGPRLASNTTGRPTVDSSNFPSRGIGYISWASSDQPKVCFNTPEANFECSATPPANTVVLDPQVGWEQQKFLIAYTLWFLPENQQQKWLDQMNIWEMGADADPRFLNRIELHLPNGKVYVAKTFGKETVLGKTVQKGISARMLEWANQLMAAAYETDPGPDNDNDGQPDWVVPRLTNGQPRVKYDATVRWVDAQGNLVAGHTGCDATDNSACTCTANRACIELGHYEEVPFFMRQAMRDYGLWDLSMRGIY